MANYNDYLEYLKHIDNTTEQEIKTKIDGLNDEISTLKTSLSNLNKVKDDLTTDLANAKKQINEKVDLINLKETELKRITTDLANVQKDLKETNFKLIELEKLHNFEQKKNATITNELAEIKSKYYILESEVKNKNKTVNDYIAEIQKLHLELENAKNDFKNASASNTSTTEQINKYRSEISNLNKIIDELRNNDNSAEVADLKIKLDRTVSELNVLSKNKQIIDYELKEQKVKYEKIENRSSFLIDKISIFITVLFTLYILLNPLFHYFQEEIKSFLSIPRMGYDVQEVNIAFYLYQFLIFNTKLIIYLSISYLITTRLPSKIHKKKIILYTVALNILFSICLTIVYFNMYSLSPLSNIYVNSFLSFGDFTNSYEWYFSGDLMILSNVIHSLLLTVILFSIHFYIKIIINKIFEKWIF